VRPRAGAGAAAFAAAMAAGIGNIPMAPVRQPDQESGSEGLLAGKKVAIKDNLCVAAVPIDERIARCSGYVPSSTHGGDAHLAGRRHHRGKAGLRGSCFRALAPTVRRLDPHPTYPAHSAAAPPRQARLPLPVEVHGDRGRPGRRDPHASSGAGSMA